MDNLFVILQTLRVRGLIFALVARKLDSLVLCPLVHLQTAGSCGRKFAFITFIPNFVVDAHSVRPEAALVGRLIIALITRIADAEVGARNMRFECVELDRLVVTFVTGVGPIALVMIPFVTAKTVPIQQGLEVDSGGRYKI